MKKELLQQNVYKRGLKGMISDFFYDVKLMFFPKLRHRSTQSYKVERTIFIVAMLALPLIQWLIFWLYVVLQSLALAFKEVGRDTWGFLNFVSLWKYEVVYAFQGYVNENNIVNALKNTFLFFGIHMLIQLPLSLIVAFFIYKKVLGYKVFRIVFYLPAVIPGIVMTQSFKELVSERGILQLITDGMIPVGGLLDPRLLEPTEAHKVVTGTIIFYYLWTSLTTSVLLFASGMARIPTEVLEAAKLDGVGPGREIVNLVIPLIWPTFTTQFIIAFTSLFSSGGPVLLLTKGNHDTVTLSYYIFYRMVGDGTNTANAGSEEAIAKVSAIGLVCTTVAVPICLFARKLLNKVETIEY